MTRDGRGRRRRRLQGKLGSLQGDHAWENHRRVLELQENCGDGKGPPSAIRATIKRKFQGLTQAMEKPNLEDQSPRGGQSLGLKAKKNPETIGYATCTASPNGPSSFATLIPEKHTLELILDVLQRRDTYKIFAVPVDPNEVEDYYEIIKEPMDFGTMRAKLHEGMYETLEQFEHDAFLISGNAMHFNSSGTIYFRQARAMDELAKKVFHVLKTDPENFELEFSGTRRRSGRRPYPVEAKDFISNSRTGPATNDVSSKDKLKCDLTGPSSSRRYMRIPVVASTGARNGRRSSPSGADKRSTYNPGMLFHNENVSMLQNFQTDPKVLLLVNQNDINYCQSLMLFVKDLGPTARMVAKRKLHTNSCKAEDNTRLGQNPNTCYSCALSPWETDIMSNTVSDPKVIDLLQGNQTVRRKNNELLIDMNAAADHDGEDASTCTSLTRAGVPFHNNIIGQRSYAHNGLTFIPRDGITRNQMTEMHCPNVEITNTSSGSANSTSTCTSTAVPLVDNGMSSENVCTMAKPELKSTASETRLGPSRLVSGSSPKEKMSSSLSSSSTTTFGFSSFSKMGSKGFMGLKCKVSTSGPSKGLDGLMMIVSNHSISSQAVQKNLWESAASTKFTFDMPFLKSQLNKMKVVGQQDKLLHTSAADEVQNQGHGTLFNPAKGYIKVPVHFAEEARSWHTPPSSSTFLDITTKTKADTDLAL